MNVFDVVVLTIVLFCLIRGLFKGLIREVSGIIGVVAGFYGANTYYLTLTPYLKNFIETPGTRNLISFFVLFCSILIFVSLVAVLIRKFLNLVFLGWVDRSFGLIFGGAKGILLGSALFIMMTTFIPENAGFLSDSKSAPHMAKVASAMTVFVSKNMKTDFLKHLEGIKSNWKQ
jgi:membrane protein required for colicin V production